MAILMPALRAARDQARRVHCVANVRTLSLAWLMYKDDNDGKLVGSMVGNSGGVDYESYGWVRAPGGDTVEEKLQAIREGLIYPYVGDTVEVYRCFADRRLKDPARTTYRSYSIANGANGEDWPDPPRGHVVTKIYSDIKRPATKYVFLEDVDTRGYNTGSWQIYFNPLEFCDPVAMWHNERTALGFADGHSEMHRWHDKSFIDWCHLAMVDDLSFDFRMMPPDNEREDLEFLGRGFPCKSHD